MSDDQFDFNLVDDDLQQEVELLTQVIIAATESDAPLTPEQIDAALGLGPEEQVPDRALDRQAEEG